MESKQHKTEVSENGLNNARIILSNKAVDEVIDLYNSTMNFINYEVLKLWKIRSRA